MRTTHVLEEIDSLKSSICSAAVLYESARRYLGRTLKETFVFHASTSLNNEKQQNKLWKQYMTHYEIVEQHTIYTLIFYYYYEEEIDRKQLDVTRRRSQRHMHVEAL